MVRKYLQKLIKKSNTTANVQPEIVEKFTVELNPNLEFSRPDARPMHHIYRELVTTEVSYLNAINALTPSVQADILSRYGKLKMTQEERAKYPSKEDLKIQFEKINLIIAAQKEMLNAFKTSTPDVWAAQLKALQSLYAEYVSLKNVTNLHPGIDSIHNQLASILVSPIQRPPRYVLLGKELLNSIPEANGNYDGCQAFHAAAIEFSNDLNERKKITEDKTTIDNLDHAILMYKKNLTLKHSMQC